MVKVIKKYEIIDGDKNCELVVGKSYMDTINDLVDAGFKYNDGFDLVYVVNDQKKNSIVIKFEKEISFSNYENNHLRYVTIW